MKDKIIPLLVVLAFSLFCGFVVIATGLGSLDSPLNRVAGPGVCGEDQPQIEKDSTAYIQGEQTHKVTAYCVSESGDKKDVSVELMRRISQLQVVTGFISALVIFGLSLLFLNWAARRLGTSVWELFKPGAGRKS